MVYFDIQVPLSKEQLPIHALPVDLLEALRRISVTINRDTCVVNWRRSENFSIIVLGGAFPNTYRPKRKKEKRKKKHPLVKIHNPTNSFRQTQRILTISSHYIIRNLEYKKWNTIVEKNDLKKLKYCTVGTLIHHFKKLTYSTFPNTAWALSAICGKCLETSWCNYHRNSVS